MFLQDIITFWYLLTRNITRPTVNFTLVHASGPGANASIAVSTSMVPDTVKMWWAVTEPTTGRRDFRLIICDDLSNPSCIQPTLWFPQDVRPQPDGTYVVYQSPPAVGWTGFLVQVNFKIPTEVRYQIHTRTLTHTRMHAHTHAHTHTHLQAYTYAHICRHTHTHGHRHTHACTRTHAHRHTCTHPCIAIHPYIHPCIQYMHPYTHTHAYIRRHISTDISYTNRHAYIHTYTHAHIYIHRHNAQYTS
jgi:hypothetical protein